VRGRVTSEKNLLSTLTTDARIDSAQVFGVGTVEEPKQYRVSFWIMFGVIVAAIFVAVWYFSRQSGELEKAPRPSGTATRSRAIAS
jgi:hypothetical protein